MLLVVEGCVNPISQVVSREWTLVVPRGARAKLFLYAYDCGVCPIYFSHQVGGSDIYMGAVECGQQFVDEYDVPSGTATHKLNLWSERGLCHACGRAEVELPGATGFPTPSALTLLLIAAFALALIALLRK